MSNLLTRRNFLQTVPAASAAAWGMPAYVGGTRPNFLVIISDQQGLDAISAHGSPDVHTPNIDRLVRSGISFQESYTAFPLCSPARSSIFTGRMPSETGVIRNGRAIQSGIPNLGQWLGQQGYETVYAGKWHVPVTYTDSIPGFQVLPSGIVRQGQQGDAAVSRACQAYLSNRRAGRPYLLVASFLQPHDICGWIADHFGPKGWEAEPKLPHKLPALPHNFQYDPREPFALKKQPRPDWSEEQWRFYLWSYYRHIEMVDAEIGRVLDAFEDSGERENTFVIMISDHGEGRGRHHKVLKNYLYDEAAKVPLVISCPDGTPAGKQDTRHLVSNLDLVPTICDYTGISAPADMRGRSLRPLIEGARTEWREFVPAEVVQGGRMIRTAGYKYVAYDGDPVEQLFDFEKDPGETRNLATDSAKTSALADHQKLLREWMSQLKPAPVPANRRRAKGQA